MSDKPTDSSDERIEWTDEKRGYKQFLQMLNVEC